MEGKIVNSLYAHRIVKEAMLCKILKCDIETLYKMDPEKVEGFTIVYRKLLEKNPMMMFG